MRVLIVGAEDVGKHLLHNLSQRSENELVVVESDAERAKALSQEYDALIIHGDPTDPNILKKAQIEQADALVAATGTDAINTVIAMLAHRFEVEKIIVKLNGYELRAACQEVGVSEIVAPTIAAAAKIQAALYGSDKLDFSELSGGGLKLVEVEVKQGRRLGKLKVPEDALLVGLVRDGEVELPKTSHTLEKGDVILVLAETDGALRKVKEQVGAHQD